MTIKHLLVVDDDNELRSLMAETLVDAGFGVVEAASGDEAINILDRLGVLDGLVTDIEMPGLTDGNQVAARAKVLYPTLPVIYVSGSIESLTNTISSHDILLSKPFRSALMIFEVRRLLGLTQTPA